MRKKSLLENNIGSAKNFLCYIRGIYSLRESNRTVGERMLKKTVKLVIINFHTNFITGGKETCPPGYEMWKGSCYRFFSDPKPFEEAIEICSQISAFSAMAAVDDESTNRFLASKN